MLRPFLSQNTLILTHIMHSLSASRLNDFLGCPHQAALWLAGVKPEEEADAALQLIRNKGFEHEAAILARLEQLHGPAERIPSDGSLTDRARLSVGLDCRSSAIAAKILSGEHIGTGVWQAIPSLHDGPS